jgi:hypothetical protein
MAETSRRKPTDTSTGQLEDLHVITENGEQCFMWNSNQLTYLAQDRHELPAILATRFGHLATRLDLSYNSLTSFKGINLFTCLNELILDNNNFEDDQLDFRMNLRLKTLSLNKNRLKNLYKLVHSIKSCFPNLEYLSLIGNPLCPGPVLNSAHGQGNAAGKRNAGKLTTVPSDAIISGGMRIDELVLNEPIEVNSNGTISRCRDAGQECVAMNRTEFNIKKYRYVWGGHHVVVILSH